MSFSTDIRFRDSYQAWIDSGGTLAFQTERAEKSFAKEVYVALRGHLSQALELKRAMPDKEIQMVFLCMEGLSWR